VTAIALRGVSDPAVIRAIAAVAEIWNVHFEPDSAGNWSDFDGIIEVQSELDCQPAAHPVGLPFLRFSNPNSPLTNLGPEVKIASNQAIPQALRGKALHVIEAASELYSVAMQTFECGASIAGHCIWGVSRSAEGTSFIVGTPPPRLDGKRHLSEILNGEKFLHALPLWLFLRSIAKVQRWEVPPLRACLIVDDPNLHRASYGHIDYYELLEFARTRPFHAAMATVPLDSWWVNGAAARLFRENHGVLSLLVHGNDHLHDELAQEQTELECLALLSQSLERTEITERKSGVRVDRVMAPPHGVCSPIMMELLWRKGFEGMTTNRWSLWKHSAPSTLPVNSGFSPADMLSGGLPVVSRFRFKSSICQNEVCLAALFGQPIVPYGHHKDFSNEMAAVKTAVDSVNALGPVRWMSMREILETNFEWRIEGQTFLVRLFSRRIKCAMPAGTTSLQVSLSPFATGCGKSLTIDWTEGDKYGQISSQFGEQVHVPAMCRLEISFRAPTNKLESGTYPRSRPRAVLQRLVSEVRDRLRL
jgi:hypothetical protein